MDIKEMKAEVERRYGIELEKTDPLLVAMALNMVLLYDDVEALKNQNKALLNELQKTQAALSVNSYPRGRVGNYPN